MARFSPSSRRRTRTGNNTNNNNTTVSNLKNSNHGSSSWSNNGGCGGILRYVWLIFTAIMGGLTTFIVFDRLNHSVEVSQLLVVSIDTMNVLTHPGQSMQQFTQQTPIRKKPSSQPQKPPLQSQKMAEKIHPKPIQPLEEREGGHPSSSITKDPKIIATPIDNDVPTALSPKDIQIRNSVVRVLEDQQSHNKVYFLNETQVTQKDSFSASWIMSRQDFLAMDLDKVGMCEDAAFKAWNTRRHKLRMPVDYFDFAIEHLSKWWKVLDYNYEYGPVWDSVISKLAKYVANGATDYPAPTKDPPVFAQTVATIAFQPYKAKGKFGKQPLPKERSYNLTIVSLAATIESIRRAEMGRVVVVGSVPGHEKYTLDAIQYMRDNLHIAHPPDNPNRVGHLEVGYVTTPAAAAKTKILPLNMPKACLVGARKAFLAAETPVEQRTENQTQHLVDWFGTTHENDQTYWQYLYLTEPDSVLTTRAESLPQIKHEMDVQGGIVAPIRLQPIPHSSDLEGFHKKDLFLHEEDGFPVLELDHYDKDNAHDVCCDAHLGPDTRPGLNDFPPCGERKWFLCGMDKRFRNENEDPHRRLRQYQLFRLKRGTGITTIAGNLFARRCFPSHNAVCKPPHIVDRV